MYKPFTEAESKTQNKQSLSRMNFALSSFIAVLSNLLSNLTKHSQQLNGGMAIDRYLKTVAPP